MIIGGRVTRPTGGGGGSSGGSTSPSPPAGGSAPVFSLQFIGIPVLYIIIGLIVLIGIIAGVMML